MTPAILWWIAVGAAVLAELVTGTFYLLMVALGLAGGAIASHLGVGPSGQFVAAALVGGGAVAAWHWHRRRLQAAEPVTGSNHDLLLDIGQQVDVTAWDARGRALVHYRGAQWQARWAAPAPAQTGRLTIRALDGNELLLGPSSS